MPAVLCHLYNPQARCYRLIRTMTAELGADNIRVMVICLGVIDTTIDLLPDS
jgi:NAD(P)-dependent dehydrogenase (short-subunit alcohol dehydrogenase family)